MCEKWGYRYHDPRNAEDQARPTQDERILGAIRISTRPVDWIQVNPLKSPSQRILITFAKKWPKKRSLERTSTTSHVLVSLDRESAITSQRDFPLRGRVDRSLLHASALEPAVGQASQNFPSTPPISFWGVIWIESAWLSWIGHWCRRFQRGLQRRVWIECHPKFQCFGVYHASATAPSPRKLHRGQCLSVDVNSYHQLVEVW